MKFCLFVALCSCLVFYSFSTASNPHLEKLGHGEYCIYSTQFVESPLIAKYFDTGFSYIYFCNSSDAANLRSLFSSIDGESITITDMSPQEVLNRLNYFSVSHSVVNGTTIIYAYSVHGKNFITNNKQKINLQIAQNGNRVVVGWPVILGSY